MKKVLLLLVLSTGAMSAQSKENPSCVGVSAAVENGQKELAAAGVSNFFDGASREPERQAKSANALSRINANLAILQAKKCAMPKDPVGANWYTEAALGCEIALSKAGREGRTDLPEECDRDKWARKTN